MSGDFIFFKARQVDVKLVTVIGFFNVGFHQVFAVFAIQRVPAAEEVPFKINIIYHLLLALSIGEC